MQTVLIKHINVSSDAVTREVILPTYDAKRLYVESLVVAGQTPDVISAVQVGDIHFEQIANGKRRCLRMKHIKITYERYS